MVTDCVSLFSRLALCCAAADKLLFREAAEEALHESHSLGNLTFGIGQLFF